MMADSHLQSGGQFIYEAQISTFDLNATKRYLYLPTLFIRYYYL